MSAQSFILSYFSSGGSVVVSTGPSKPRVLYANLMRDGAPTSVTATSEPDPTFFPYQNAYDWKQFTAWKCAEGTHYLTAVFPSAKTVNAYGIYATNLAEIGGSIQLQYWNGAAWTDYRTAEAPNDTTPIYRSHNTVTANQWRWKVTVPAGEEALLSVLTFGEEFEFQRGCYVGFSPPKLARDTTLTTNISQGGAFLGRSILRNGSTFAFDLDRLTPGWVRDTWYPFQVHAEQEPFFLLWNKQDYPGEAAYCWAAADIPGPSNSHPSFMRASMRVDARVDDL